MNSALIRQLTVAALKAGTTDAGDRVYTPRDWPTHSADYPALMVQTPFDHKHSMGRNAPQFVSVTTVRITGRVEAFDTADAECGALLAEEALERLRLQVEQAVINSYELTRQTQQYKEVRSTIDVDSGGESHIGQLLYEIDMEYYQGPEDFYPVASTPLESLTFRHSEPDGTAQTGFDADLTT
ncbi:ATP-binding protein [Nissabacter sp. SGAir0207]|uniref:ATP-binding protein n=1 Tax=Nissabacter sp. SGAir0207 TaxID=2126321 RepID=UPI0010CD3EE5|nr:ATP-binding protein [Nissabacter sp. SGAir0207]QCR38948.1 ATP-binding protein [Nissabacter sp. SGAir0207]